MFTKYRKLSRAQYDELWNSYDEAMEQTTSDYRAAHVRLMSLLNGHGYTVQSREESFRVAKGLLDNGYYE